MLLLGQRSLLKFFSDIRLELYFLLGGHFEQSLALKSIESCGQQFSDFWHGLQEVVHMRVAHDAVFEGLFGLHQRRMMIIMEDSVSSPAGIITYPAQMEYSGRIVSQPLMESRLGEWRPLP